MRNIILHALQCGDFGVDPIFDNVSAGFDVDLSLVIKKHVMPRLELNADMIKRCCCAGSAQSTSSTMATLILTNEDICGLGWFLLKDKVHFDELVVLSSQIVEERFSELAKELAVHIAACYYKRTNSINYNVTSIFSPGGQIVGEYCKTHIPPNEMWQLADGGALNVIELEFGKIGVLICYDMMFPEAASVLASEGAEIILHPTAGYGWYDSIGEATLRTRANDNSVYMVTAKNHVYNAAGKSSIIDPWGQVLADAGFYKNVIVSKEIDLDIPKAQPDWFYQSQMSGFAEIRQRTPFERRPELYGCLSIPAQRLRVPDDAERAILREKVRKEQCRWG